MPPKQTEITRSNKLGGRTVKIISVQVYSFKEYNQNQYYLHDDLIGVEIPATPTELTMREKGHYYVMRRVSEHVWEVNTPARFADEETSQLLASVRPIPVDEKLTKKFGKHCEKWQAISDRFRVSSSSAEVLMSIIESHGGVIERIRYDMNLADVHLAVVHEQWGTAQKDHQTALELSLKTKEPDRVANLADALDARLALMARQKDNITRHRDIHMNTYGPKEDGAELTKKIQKVESLISEVMSVQDSIRKIYADMVDKAVSGLTTSSPDTVADLLGSMSTAMPALKHLKLQGADIIVEYDSESGRCLKITEHGAELYYPEAEEQPDKFTKLELD